VAQIAFILKDSIPPFNFLAKIIQTLSRAEQTADVRELIRVIKQEPSTSAKILQVANSAAYMGSKEITSIESASAIMGIAALKSVVLSNVIASKFDTKKCPNFNATNYWLESVITGENAATIYNTMNEGISNDIDIYCVGLLSNIGLLFLVNQFPDILNIILQDVTEEQPLSMLLNDSFGLDEYEISAKLLEFWELPEIFPETARRVFNFKYTNQYNESVRAIRAAKKITQFTLNKTLLPITEEDFNETNIDLSLPNFSNENFIEIASKSNNNFEKNKLIAEAICR